MFERPGIGERAILVHVNQPIHEWFAERQEFEELALGSGVEVLFSMAQVLRRAEPKYLLGKGKAEFIAEAVKATKAEVVIFGHSLTPSQERNLEKLLCCRVLDRNGLILDIFAQRARSFEGKLQVELAQLRHLSTRLVRGWTHLERQKGGIGLRGPGETQLETDRRLLAVRIKSLSAKLSRIVAQRDQQRATRRKTEVPTVSLVGYTNAGKSTLFNRLTGAGAYQADQLFATLDPTLRRLHLRPGQHVVLADTVGFIRDLPPELLAAFRATLEETREASMLLHVVDAADARWEDTVMHVDETLDAIEADEIPQLIVMNKLDQLGGDALRFDEWKGRPVVWVSAQAGTGMQELRDLIASQVYKDSLQGWHYLAANEGGLRARLYRDGYVVNEQAADDGGCWLELCMSASRFQSIFGAGETLAQEPGNPVLSVGDEATSG